MKIFWSDFLCKCYFIIPFNKLKLSYLYWTLGYISGISLEFHFMYICQKIENMKYCYLPQPTSSSKLRKVKYWCVYTNNFLMGMNRIPLHFWQWVNFINGGHKPTLVIEIVEFLTQIRRLLYPYNIFFHEGPCRKERDLLQLSGKYMLFIGYKQHAPNY